MSKQYAVTRDEYPSDNYAGTNFLEGDFGGISSDSITCAMSRNEPQYSSLFLRSHALRP